MTTPRLYIACFDKANFMDNSELEYIQISLETVILKEQENNLC